MKDFWFSFQKYLGNNQLPTFIVEIFKVTGYDTAIAIQTLNENKIEEIESFIELNAVDYSFLCGTAYENISKFKLLPGHVSLMLGSVFYAKKFIEENLKKKTIIQVPRNLCQN